jgi:hypothetical protein
MSVYILQQALCGHPGSLTNAYKEVCFLGSGFLTNNESFILVTWFLFQVVE